MGTVYPSWVENRQIFMSELTKRKGGGVLSDGEDDLERSGKSNGDVWVVEYDVRPSCANEPPVRYVKHGEQLQARRGSGIVMVHDETALSRFSAGCCSYNGLMRELKEMFLPAGYPDSVSEDYLTFQFWDTIQAVCSYLRGVLATQSVLQSVGVGDEHATPLAAALQWVLRDGSGMIGGLTFAYLVGPKFDLNVKRWRLFADVINDVGLTLDMVAPYFPNVVTEVLCFSQICKTMCGVAAGATRSSLMTHFAKRDNMADCAAKEGSQETAVKLFGLVFGMYFANAVNSSREAIWVAFLSLTLVHVYANYQAVSGLCIPTLNRQRALILVERFIAAKSTQSKEDFATTDRFTVRSVNRVEPIYNDPKLPIARILMGSQLYLAVDSHLELDELLQLYSNEKYLLTVAQGSVHVIFRADMKPTDEIRAFFQAVLVLQSLVEDESSAGFNKNHTGRPSVELLQRTLSSMSADFESFTQMLQSNGWRTHMFLLNTSAWRIKLSDDS